MAIKQDPSGCRNGRYKLEVIVMLLHNTTNVDMYTFTIEKNTDCMYLYNMKETISGDG